MPGIGPVSNRVKVILKYDFILGIFLWSRYITASSANNDWSTIVSVTYHACSLRKQPTFGNATTGFPTKWRLRSEHRNSILTTHHYPDLGSACDWLNQISHRTNQKYYPDLGSDLSSVLNFCIHLSDSDTVRWDDVKVLKSHWNFVKTKTMTPGNNIYTLLVTFITFTSFISSKARFKRWTLHVPNLIPI